MRIQDIIEGFVITELPDRDEWVINFNKFNEADDLVVSKDFAHEILALQKKYQESDNSITKGEAMDIAEDLNKGGVHFGDMFVKIKKHCNEEGKTGSILESVSSATIFALMQRWSPCGMDRSLQEIIFSVVGGDATLLKGDVRELMAFVKRLGL